jgi:hypothetical protein
VHGTGQLANAARAKEAALIDLMNARAGRAEADATTPSIPEPEAAPAVPIPDPEPPTPPPEVGNAKAAPAVPIPDPEPLPEGASRYLSKELVRAAGAITGVPSYYCAHVGRGKWQDKSIEELHASLGEGKNRGRLLMLTIDMKSKTETGKNREPQGHGFGGRGMGLQGGMVDVCVRGEIRTYYCDLIYEQSSNQKIEEAMSGLDAQLDALKRRFPTVEEVIIVSDKCSNFNAFCQIPFIIEGNERNWTKEGSVEGKQCRKVKQDLTDREVERDAIDLTGLPDGLKNETSVPMAKGTSGLPDDTKNEPSVPSASDTTQQAPASKILDVPRKFCVVKWTFTETQCGKDRLDCHFSWTRRLF